MAEAAIDVIDIEPYLAGDPAGTRRVVGAVRAACERSASSSSRATASPRSWCAGSSVLADGTQMSERADFHRGKAEHPHDAVRRKFLGLAAPVWGQGRGRYYDGVLDLEGVPDVASLAGAAGL